MNEFDFSANGTDRQFFADLYVFLKKATEMPVLTVEEYKATIKKMAWALVDGHKNSYFAGIIPLDCLDIIGAIKCPQAIAQSTDEKMPDDWT